MRNTEEHWELLLNFAEHRREIVTNQFVGPRGRENLNHVWEDLCKLLNGIGKGEKSLHQWKQSLADWKSNTKKKYAMIRTSINKTGGGPGCKLVLTVLEERLLNLMGVSAFYGDVGVEEYGLDTDENITVEENLTSKFIVQSTTSSEASTSNCIQEEDIIPELIKKRKAESSKDTTSRTKKRKAELSDRIEDMNNATLDVLRSIDGHMGDISQSLKQLVELGTKFMNHATEEDGSI